MISLSKGWFAFPADSMYLKEVQGTLSGVKQHTVPHSQKCFKISLQLKMFNPCDILKHLAKRSSPHKTHSQDSDFRPGPWSLSALSQWHHLICLQPGLGLGPASRFHMSSWKQHSRRLAETRALKIVEVRGAQRAWQRLLP